MPLSNALAKLAPYILGLGRRNNAWQASWPAFVGGRQDLIVSQKISKKAGQWHDFPLASNRHAILRDVMCSCDQHSSRRVAPSPFARGRPGKVENLAASPGSPRSRAGEVSYPAGMAINGALDLMVNGLWPTNTLGAMATGLGNPAFAAKRHPWENAEETGPTRGVSATARLCAPIGGFDNAWLEAWRVNPRLKTRAGVMEAVASAGPQAARQMAFDGGKHELV